MPERIKQLHHWLQNDLKLKDYDMVPASGDASFRRYFRITDVNGNTFIAMDAPPDKEDCEPFVRIARQLESHGLNVPSILEENHHQGFLLLKDLGNTQYLEVLNESNVDDLYGDALTALLKIQNSCNATSLPEYDKPLLMREMELFREWLLQKHLGLELSNEENQILDDVFEFLAQNALEQPNVFVHRDYHSRNLMLVEDAAQGKNPGILDFQDAVNGPITYDLVSLIKDCYIEWPREKVIDWARAYCSKCIEAGLIKAADEDQFMSWFDLMGAQRHLKAAGIFARLNHRDGKDGYLKDIPRTVGYIQKLKSVYPELDGLIALIDEKMN